MRRFSSSALPSSAFITGHASGAHRVSSTSRMNWPTRSQGWRQSGWSGCAAIISTLADCSVDRDRTDLFNVAAAIPEERRFSRKDRGRKELLDQIWASEELFPVNTQNQRQGPVDADSFIDFAGQLESVAEDPNARAGAIAPDHAPVSATFSI
jgi:hypothetical protein